MSANLDGAFLIARAALPTLIGAGLDRAVASQAARRVGPAQRRLLHLQGRDVMLTQTIAVDYGPLGVRANAVCPAWTRTAMADAAMDELAASRGIDRAAAYREANAAVPARRAAEPDEVAALVVWIASAQAATSTGR